MVRTSEQTARCCPLGERIAASTRHRAPPSVEVTLVITSPHVEASSAVLLMPSSRSTSGWRRGGGFVVANVKWIARPVSAQVRRSSGWHVRPLHKQGLASTGAQTLPLADRTATSSRLRASDKLLVTNNLFNTRLPVAAQRSSSEGSTRICVTAQGSKIPGRTYL